MNGLLDRAVCSGWLLPPPSIFDKRVLMKLVWALQLLQPVCFARQRWVCSSLAACGQAADTPLQFS